MEVVAELGRFALKNWKMIVIAGLLIALALTRHTLDNVRADLETSENWRQDVRATTSRAAGVTYKGKPALLALDQVAIQIVYLGNTVDRLTGALEAKNAESRARAEQLVAARQEDERNNADADRRYATAQTSIARLRVIAEETDGGRCPADPALLRELEGL